jgi:Uma2 family endonuclease
MPVQAPRRLFTVREFHRMAEAGVFSEDDRVELLAGEIVEMTPIGSRHAACVKRLNAMLSSCVGMSLIVSVQDPIELGDHSEPQPDLAVLRFRPDFYRDAHPGPADVVLVVEVADTSAETDRVDKVPLYARAGIPEVWLVDLGSRLVDVYRQPSPGAYRDHRRAGPGDRLTSDVLPGLDLPVSQVVS